MWKGTPTFCDTWRIREAGNHCMQGCLVYHRLNSNGADNFVLWLFLTTQFLSQGFADFITTLNQINSSYVTIIEEYALKEP